MVDAETEKCVSEIERSFQDIDRSLMLIPEKPLNDIALDTLDSLKIQVSAIRNETWQEFKTLCGEAK